MLVKNKGMSVEEVMWRERSNAGCCALSQTKKINILSFVASGMAALDIVIL